MCPTSSIAVIDLTDGGELWLRPYESDDFPRQVDELYEELKPFYEKLHAYVRHKLRLNYGMDKIDPVGPIPAHLLGKTEVPTSKTRNP
jgi:peptidyl-dipeptidase A